MNEVYLDYLAHHGILGMRWGVRRFQDYGHGGYDPKRKGLFKGRRKGKTSTSKSVVKKGKTGGKLTEEQKARIKKAAIVGAAVAGTALTAYGTYKVSKYVGGKKLAKSIAESGPTILNKNTGQKFTGDAADILGSKSVGAITKNAAQTATSSKAKQVFGTVEPNYTMSKACFSSNPHGGKKNCGPVSASILARHNDGVNLVAKDTQITNWTDWEKAFPGAKHSTVNIADVTDPKSLTKYLDKKFKDGDNGMLRLPSVDSSKFDDHFITFSKENGKMIYRDGQVKGLNGTTGMEFDIDGNVTIGGVKVSNKNGKELVKKFFDRYNVEITDYMQVNGHKLTDDVVFLGQFFDVRK